MVFLGLGNSEDSQSMLTQYRLECTAILLHVLLHAGIHRMHEGMQCVEAEDAVRLRSQRGQGAAEQGSQLHVCQHRSRGPGESWCPLWTCHRYEHRRAGGGLNTCAGRQPLLGHLGHYWLHLRYHGDWQDHAIAMPAERLDDTLLAAIVANGPSYGLQTAF
jgi:hypothetical protein